jgi:hypothetical protein
MWKYNAKGNSKIGNAFITNRAVGDSCPPSCSFLNDGCYAEFTEKLYPNVRKHDVANTKFPTIKLWNLIRSMLINAVKTGNDVRIHERGDFFKNGKLDRSYLGAYLKALKSLADSGKEIPKIWVYTHSYNKEILKLAEFGVQVYASVSNESQMRRAKKAGFKLFAFADKFHIMLKRSRKKNPAELPKIEWEGEKFLVCPEQRLGRDKVTCCGNETSKACMWCVNGRGNVAFIDH